MDNMRGLPLLLFVYLNRSPYCCYSCLNATIYLSRCKEGEEVGCHAVILAASSQVLKRVLEDSRTEEGPTVILMLDFPKVEVENLLSFLYTGCCLNTPTLNCLVKTFGHVTGDLVSDGNTVEALDDVKEEVEYDGSGEEDDLKTELEDSNGNTHDEDGTPHQHILQTILEVKVVKVEPGCDLSSSKDIPIQDEHVDFELYMKQVNENPKSSVKTMVRAGIPIFYYPCDYCKLTFTKIDRYKSHITNEHKEKLDEFDQNHQYYHCSECEQLFLTSNSLRKHLKKHHNKGNWMNGKQERVRRVCPHCKLQWTEDKDGEEGFVSFIEHVAAHKLGSTEIICLKCEMKFDKISTLKLHLKKNHPRSEVICPECGEKFASVKYLNRHAKKHQEKSEVICPECGEKFASIKYLNRHAKKHQEKSEEKEDKLYVCNLCGVQFPKYATLHYHMRTGHRDPYAEVLACEHCGKKFTIRSNLTSHQQLHYPPTLPCQLCGTLFHNAKYLKLHINKVHTDMSQRRHQCEQCPKAFDSKRQMSDHMNMHLGLTPYQCR